ncbi:MAG: hypothetical protein FWF87_08060 [Synergistaceae bacterium]|nr:hypothetical protein [Synergistaceae bacterium]
MKKFVCIFVLFVGLCSVFLSAYMIFIDRPGYILNNNSKKVIILIFVASVILIGIILMFKKTSEALAGNWKTFLWMIITVCCTWILAYEVRVLGAHISHTELKWGLSGIQTELSGVQTELDGIQRELDGIRRALGELVR